MCKIISSNIIYAFKHNNWCLNKETQNFATIDLIIVNIGHHNVDILYSVRMLS